MPIYRHRQVGTWILSTLGFGAAMAAVASAIAPSAYGRIVAGAVLVFVVACLVLFGTLTVEVSADRLAVWFGPGLIRKSFPVGSVRGARTVRNPWYFGWGIRLTPYGWLFNVSGCDAVELLLENNQRFRIGTDEPQQLLTAIHQVLRNAR